MIVSEEIAKELPEYCGLLSDLSTKVTDVINHIDSVNEYVLKDDFSIEKGISLLELKSHLMLNYLINIVQLMLLKIRGQSISNSPTIDRLIELRVILEKMRPLEMKLRYQIDKLVKVASTGLTVSVNDPLHYKPNPDNLVPKVNTEVGPGGERRIGKYVPPKLRAMPFEEESEKEKSKEEKRKKKALHSSLVEELRDELSEGPQEIKDVTRGSRHRKREREEDKDRERYEEDYFIRMSGKKKQRVEGMTQAIDDLLDFKNLSSNRKKTSGGGGGKKKSGVKRKLLKGKKGGKSKSSKKNKGKRR